jgi:glycolate oxidase iron-sulfur subunit
MSGLVKIAEQAEQAGAAVSNFSAHDKPTWEMYSTCIHCGLCLNHCPTYRVLGTEMDSPRGRIYQVLQVDSGRMALDDSFVTHIDRCLGCLACETACPSGVHYGQIVERARAQIETAHKRSAPSRLVRWFFFDKVLRDFHWLSRVARLLRLYQRSGLQWMARRSGILHLLGLARRERLMPAIDTEFFLNEIGTMSPAEGTRRATVAFHTGCIANVAFSDLNRATVKLLNHNGVDVFIVQLQRCCGALHAHSGLREEARLLARRNIRAMEEAGREFDAVITNSAGCGSHMKDYADLLHDDAEYAEAARKFASLTRDVTEFVDSLGFRQPRFRLESKVAYQDPCHLAHAQKIRSAPRSLLKRVGAELVELPHPDQCCGSAGSYNVTENKLSMQILDRKLDDVSTVASDIKLLITANTGCQLQLHAGMAGRGMNVPVRHIVEVLADLY